MLAFPSKSLNKKEKQSEPIGANVGNTKRKEVDKSQHF